MAQQLKHFAIDLPRISWFCHDKHFIIPGTEDMIKDYHDYWFHIKGGFIGMLLAIPAALVAGLITIL